jgi:hypothetical protein
MSIGIYPAGCGSPDGAATLRERNPLETRDIFMKPATEFLTIRRENLGEAVQRAIGLQACRQPTRPVSGRRSLPFYERRRQPTRLALKTG